jgi:hypothetical protein
MRPLTLLLPDAFAAICHPPPPPPPLPLPPGHHRRCQGKVLQLETGCPLRSLFEVTSLEKLKLKLSKAEVKSYEQLKN